MERSERIGQPIPDETISREANAALEELERSQQRVQQATERTSNTARELGLTFSSAFEDAIIKGESFSKVLQGILQDIARIVVRRTITEPLAAGVSAGISGFDFGSIFAGIGSALGGLFRAEGGPVAGGQPYIVGERGPEWFVPNRSGTVLPNGMAPNGMMGGGPVINQSITIDARGADAGSGGDTLLRKARDDLRPAWRPRLRQQHRHELVGEPLPKLGLKAEDRR